MNTSEMENEFLRKCLIEELDRGTQILKQSQESAIRGFFIGILTAFSVALIGLYFV